MLQPDLFPIANEEEIKQTKTLLSRYRRMKTIINELERDLETLAPKQESVYNAYKHQTDLIERSLRLIMDDDVRRMVEMRYIKGERHKITVSYFNTWHSSTVDRKINEGIKTIANTIKFWV
jgi:ribosomal protein S13